MKLNADRPGRPTGLRRLVTGAAGLALVAGAFASGSVAHADEEPDDLGSAADYGVVPPATDTVFQDGVISGSPTVPSAYFIQLEGEPTSAGNSAAAIGSEQISFLAEAARRGVSLEINRTYRHLWNGFAVTASDADIAVLAEVSQVEAIFPVYVIVAPEIDPATIAPAMESALGMTGADEAHALGFTGEGLKIAIIDTGVDVDHPDFGGGGEPTDGLHPNWKTDQIQYGVDFVGDSFNANPQSAAYDPVAVPDGNPDDCHGHGTHVAGIAAGNGVPGEGVVGVAPDATIGAYRVFGCGGSTTAEIMLAAMEQSYEDGMDVINMSIGSAFMTWSQYPTAVAADSAVDAGIVVVASIGNSGASGLYSAGAPGVGEKVIGVASYENAVVTLNAILISPDDAPVGYVNSTGAPLPPTEGTETLSRLGDPGSPQARACSSFPPPDDGGITVDLTGTTVLIQRGICPFYEKAFNAQEAGADAVVLYNNVPGLINPTVEPPTPDDPPITIPVIFIQESDGEFIDERVADGETTLTWTDEVTTAPAPGGGLISSFSSYGLSADLGFKPDIGGPGGNIYSAYPIEAGGYATSSGTSMSAPHVAGGAALLLQAKPDLSPLQVRDVLQNHADPQVWSLNPGLGFLEGAFRQGAGMLDIDDAILATTSISPGKIPLGDAGGDHSVTLRITNDGDGPVTYVISNDNGTVAAGPPSNNPGFFLDPAVMSGPAEVTVAAGATVPVDLEFIPPTSANRLYSGWVTFTPDDGGDPLRVPYAGHSGDYQDLAVLTPGASGALPVLGQIESCARFIGADCAWNGVWNIYPDTGAGDQPVFTLVDGDYPTVLMHLAHQSRSRTLTVYEADEDGSQGAEVGVGRVDEFLARSSSEGDFDAPAWDGTVDGAVVPDGKYILEVTIAKAQPFHDDGPAQTETYTSEPFTIASEIEDPTGPQVDRLFGIDRYGTAARISAQYAPGVETVYIATGLNYPDALAGGAVAGALDVPLLLVRPDRVPAPTQFELDRLQPQNIVILGDNTTISGQVESTLRDFTDGSVSRVFGNDRYETAAALAEDYAPGLDTVYVATGERFPDALTGSARAGAVDAPVLLVKHNHLPLATAAALDRLAPNNIVILGDEDAVSSTVAGLLAAYGSVTRTEGDDRYATAVAISADYEPGINVAYVATGLNFPDALAGAARAGHLEAPVLLVQTDHIPAVTWAELERLQARQIVILGGFDTITTGVQQQLAALSYVD